MASEPFVDAATKPSTSFGNAVVILLAPSVGFVSLVSEAAEALQSPSECLAARAAEALSTGFATTFSSLSSVAALKLVAVSFKEARVAPTLPVKAAAPHVVSVASPLELVTKLDESLAGFQATLAPELSGTIAFFGDLLEPTVLDAPPLDFACESVTAGVLATRFSSR